VQKTIAEIMTLHRKSARKRNVMKTPPRPDERVLTECRIPTGVRREAADPKCTRWIGGSLYLPTISHSVVAAGFQLRFVLGDINGNSPRRFLDAAGNLIVSRRRHTSSP
jgi:hypothetical protein